MLKTIIEDIYEVTETLQNGNESKHKKSVYSNPFRVENGVRIHNGQVTRVQKGMEALKQNHYYNIHYIKSQIKTVIVTDYGEEQ